MPGIAFVGVHYKNQSKRRKDLSDRKSEHRKFIKTVLAKWDKSGTGALSFEELRNWLTDIAKGEKATDEEVRWVQSMANLKDTQRDDSEPGFGGPRTGQENMQSCSVSVLCLAARCALS